MHNKANQNLAKWEHSLLLFAIANIIAHPRMLEGKSDDEYRGCFEVIDHNRNKFPEQNTSLREGIDENPFGSLILTYCDLFVTLHKSDAPEKIKKCMRKITERNATNCSDTSLAEVEKALKKAEKNSHVFLVTDADAKDTKLLSIITKLIREKQLTVNVLMTGKSETFGGHRVFFDIAEASGGQVFQISKKDVEDVLSAIITNVDDDFVKVKSEYFQSWSKSKTNLMLDSSIKKLFIAFAGEHVNFNVTNSRNETMIPTETIEKSNMILMTFNVTDSLCVIESKSNSTYSLAIGGKSKLKMQFGFSRTSTLSRLSDTQPEPLKRGPNYLSIFPSDPKLIKGLTNAILIPNDKNVETSKLTLVESGVFYITKDAVNIPATTFKIAVQGQDALGLEIERVISTDIMFSDAFPPTISTIYYFSDNTSYLPPCKHDDVSVGCLFSSMSGQIINGPQILFNGKAKKLNHSLPNSLFNNLAIKLIIKDYDINNVGKYECWVGNSFGNAYSGILETQLAEHTGITFRSEILNSILKQVVNCEFKEKM